MMRLSDDQPTRADFEEYKVTARPLYQDLWKLRDQYHHQSRDPHTYLEHVLRRLTAAEKQRSSRRMEKLLTAVHRQLWQDFQPLVDCLQAFKYVFCALGSQILGGKVGSRYASRMPMVFRDPNEASTHMTYLVETLLKLRVPKAMMVSAIAHAATTLCRRWVEVNYGDYASASRESNILSLMNSLQSNVVLEFCPVARRYAACANLETSEEMSHSSMAHMASTSSAEDDGLPQRPEETLSRADRDWRLYAMLYLGKLRAEQAWEILHIQDLTLQQYLLADLADMLLLPEGRAKINKALQISFVKHLLHPGSSTVAVLDEYMLIVKTLTMKLSSGKKVDETGVILDSVANSIRHFLKTRDDAAQIVIQSLLDPKGGDGREPPASHDGFSGRVSMAMYHYDEDSGSSVRPYEGQDLTDLQWQPKPVDARSTHGGNVSKDDIGHVTSIQDDKVFIKELEKILAERLLQTDRTDFFIEERLLTMFRTRFDEETGDKTLVQNSDVMLADMLCSLNQSEKIFNTIGLSDLLNLRVHIISANYWDNIKDRAFEGFHMPFGMVRHFWAEFARGYGRITEDEQELQSLQELGRMTVEIELEDRTIEEEVTAAQASVLAFFSAELDGEVNENAGRDSCTVNELTGGLRMAESLVRECLAFWVGKMVLRQTAHDADAFYVQETLTAEEEERQATTAAEVEAEVAESAQIAGQKEQDAAQDATYAAFVLAMLENVGSMPVSDIAQRLSFFVPGGFEADLGELEALLQTMENNGEIQRDGAMWMIRTQEDAA